MTYTAAVIAIVVLGASGCREAPAARTSTAASASQAKSALPAVKLPDLAALSPSVQAQLRDGAAELAQRLEREAGASATAAAFGQLGRLLMAAKFVDEAVLCFAHAEAREPARVEWVYLRAHGLLRNGHRAEAAAAFERAAARSPTDATILVWLGETQLDDGQAAAAQATFERALSLQPEFAAALFGAGRAALAQQHYPDAARHLAAALRLEPSATAVHYPLAMAYRGLGQRDQVEEHLRQRGTAYPPLPDPFIRPDDEVLESAIAYEDRGMQALRRGDFPSAEAAFRKGLVLVPHDASLRYWLGAALFASGRREAAEREFLAVVQRSPEFAKAHFSLGMVYESSGRAASALEHFQRAVAADPGLPEARLRLGNALGARGDFAGALAQYQRAVRIDPMLVEAWIGGAHALTALARAQDAAAWRADARRLHPGRAELAEPKGDRVGSR